MDQVITGSISVSDKQCPFSYDAITERLTFYLGGKGITVPTNTVRFVGQQYGIMNGGGYLFKLELPLSNSCLSFADGQPIQYSLTDQIGSVEYYIENYEVGSRYKEMRLSFPELDYFVPSCSRVTVSEDKWSFSRAKDVVLEFSIKYRDTDVSVTFETKASCNAGMRVIAETLSDVVLCFPETDDLDYLQGLYEAARAFFVFICNRKNIGLRNATLIGEYPTKRLHDGRILDAVGRGTQIVHYSQKYYEEEDAAKIKYTIRNNLLAANLPQLFQMFSEKTIGEMAMINCSSIHHSIKYRNLIDLEQSLHITASFEYYVRTFLPEISSKITMEFFADLENLLDGYIGGLTGKKKKKAESFKKSLRPQLSLSEKMKKAYEGYSEWLPLKPILVEWFGEDITDLAESANTWRNELAHEKREFSPDAKVVSAVRLVEHMNYCIVLRKAGYDDDQIKAIITEILVR